MPQKSNGQKPTYEELQAKLEQMQKQQNDSIHFKVSEKGGVSVYGLGRFPVTLYYEQWNKLLGASEDLEKFIAENKSKLKMREVAA